MYMLTFGHVLDSANLPIHGGRAMEGCKHAQQGLSVLYLCSPVAVAACPSLSVDAMYPEHNDCCQEDLKSVLVGDQGSHAYADGCHLAWIQRESYTLSQCVRGANQYRIIIT